MERASDTMVDRLRMRGTQCEEHEDEGDDPDDERQQSSRQSSLREEDERAQRIHGDEPERVADLDHRFAERRAGLDDLGGDAPGEIVGEEADRLAEHVAVRLPADEIGERWRQRLLDEQVVQDGRRRSRDHDDEAHPGKRPAVVGEDACPALVALRRSTIEAT